jgi:hypothetical protein
MILFAKGEDLYLTKKKNKIKKECLKCLKEKDTGQFYKSNSTLYSDGLFPVCKLCLKKELKLEDPYSKEAIESLKIILQQMNRPFLSDLWITSIEESRQTGKEVFGMYWKNLQLNFKDYTWRESVFDFSSEKKREEEFKYEVIDKEEARTFDSQDKNDVIRMLGYDPFEFELEEDKPRLYSSLINYLDESAMEDGFKLQAVIEIVTGFNQIEKINKAITEITNDPERMTSKSGGIKILIDSKKNILSSLIQLAAENGISVKHNTQKSKGAGTLSGIIKTLHEQGVDQGELNLFDIETSKGMLQVADISNQSIIKQLQFDENDYTQMIIEQRELIKELDEKVMKLEEDNRLLKKEIVQYKSIDENE